MNWNWIPGIRCGPYFFGQPLPVSAGLTLTLLEPSCDGADWQTYRVGDEEARVRVENGVITAVECTLSLCYRGRIELLRLSVNRVDTILGGVLSLERLWGDGTSMYEAESLGLTLWVEDGKVESATVESVLPVATASSSPPYNKAQA